MAAISVKELLDAGVHFGHPVSRWNPRMAPYIHGKRNLIHIINRVETLKGLMRARHFLKELAATGRQIVVVGTKRQIKGVVEAEARRANMPFVNERWLGGTLTNFTTIRSRLRRLEELEGLEVTGEIAQYSKKMQSAIMRELKRIKKNLDGVRTLERIPGALLVVDPVKEYIAVREANRLGVPIVSILDTDCDPDKVDLAIPANDDAMKSVSLLLAQLADAIIEGRANFRESVVQPEQDEPVIEMKKKEMRGGQRRPPRRDRPTGGFDRDGGGGGAAGGDSKPADAPAAPAT